jgi:hypothetical protein
VGDKGPIAPQIHHGPLPELAEIHVADPPERWEALGFATRDGGIELGGIRVTLGVEGHGITRWAIRGLKNTTEIDGLPTAAAPPQPPLLNPETVPHPNGATGIDHVVVTSPDFDRTAAALNAAGIPLKRIRDAGGFLQGFRRLGPAILELVEARQAPPGHARFWGLVVIVTDLEALKDRLGNHLGAVKPAVQPGRQIATLRPSAGVTPRLAFMDPEP